MRNRLSLLCCFPLVTLAVGCGGESGAPADPAASRVTDLAGRAVDPFVESEGRLLVLIFVRTVCPISNRYAPVVGRLVEEFRDQPVDFRLVYAETVEDLAVLEQHRTEYAYPCPALHDRDLHLVDLGKVQVTPEAAVFRDRTLLYHGRIDDQQQDLNRRAPAPSRRDLEVALREVLAGEPVSVPMTQGVGCLIADLR